MYRLVLVSPTESSAAVQRELEIMEIPQSDFSAALCHVKLIGIVLNQSNEVFKEATAYLTYCSNRSRSVEGDTIRTYGESIVAWLNYLEQRAILLNEVTEPDVQAYRNSLVVASSKGDRRASSTVSIRVGTVIRFTKWLTVFGWCPSPLGAQLAKSNTNIRFASTQYVRQPIHYRDSLSPVIRLPRSEKRIPLPVAVDQIWKLTEVLAPQYRIILSWAVSTGLRRFELCNLELATLPSEGVRKSSNGFYEMSVHRKGGKQQTIYIVPKLLEDTIWYVLTQRSQPETGHEKYIFLNNSGRKIDKNLLSRTFRKAFNDAGINATFHGLRHTFAITLLELLERHVAQGAAINPLKIVQVLMGHTSIETTDIYLRSLEMTSPAVEEALGFLYGHTQKG